MDDVPSAIAPPGGPISAPVRSLWQTDTVGLLLARSASLGPCATRGRWPG
jgi:hypothetical protein